MRSVVFAAPFLLETSLRFARAAARLPDVRLLAVVQEPPPHADRSIFADVVEVADCFSVPQLIEAIERLRARHGQPHRIVGVLEPLQVQLAKARAHFGVEGTDEDTADLFRDKARMKDRLRQAGLPVARHALLGDAGEAAAFEASVGYPMVVKPPAGMGAKATFRVRSGDELRAALTGMSASAAHPILAEEFLQGEEGSFDTITLGGVVQHSSISRYLPTPLEVLENPWIQWRCVLPAQIDGPEYDEVRRVGTAAIEILGLRDGFTHMEWFRRADGSIAIGEIAQRPPGANITRMIGLADDFDPYRAWARAVIDGAFDGPHPRRHAVGCAYLRGMGRGRVAGCSGVHAAQEAVGHLVVETLLPTPGAPRNDSYEGDGYALVRSESTDEVIRALQTIIETVRVHYL
ncbi:MAG: ATP-grasp domain-containing protein [Deltaproteobacteria bacterium]|nr:ATP-grasp domain-containing protein [Deltaproteobacteria bacterium]